MSMSNRDFIALANRIKQHNAKHPTSGWNAPSSKGGVWGAPFNASHLDALADFCAEQNPLFKRERWLSYIKGECGSSGGRVKQERQSVSQYEYELQGLYGSSWECVMTEDTRAEGLKRLYEYRENEPRTSFRLVPVPVKAVKS